jgi:glycosyltransferase involved in cell wall biosynthesis
MKIAVVIPTYKKHLPFLNRCLRSIENQTRRPDLVVISASSCVEEDIQIDTYSFPIRISHTPHAQNAATNRNCAAKQIGENEADILSFFDSDDEMYPQRLEFIERGFRETDCALLVHGFNWLRRSTDSSAQTRNTYEILTDLLIPHPNPRAYGIAPTKSPWADMEAPFAHGHVSVHYTIWKSFPYDQSPSALWVEDSTFCRKILLSGAKCSFITTELSIYHNY